MWMSISFGIALVVILLGVVSLFVVKKQLDTQKYYEISYMSWGIALGMLIGMPLGFAMDNFALGPGAGLPIGLALGAALDAKYGKKKIKLTEKNKKRIWYSVLAGVALLIIGVAVFLALSGNW